MTFHHLEEYQTFENLFKMFKTEELTEYERVLHRIQSIDREFQVNQIRSFFSHSHPSNI